MATIVTVQGTNASGSEEGDKWWQKGSTFEHDLRRLIQAKDGNLEFKPHIWDGANSEISRRRTDGRQDPRSCRRRHEPMKNQEEEQ